MAPALTRLVVIVSLLAGASTGSTTVGADDPVVTARDLYQAAAYREALDFLQQPQLQSVSAASRTLLTHYRALCLLALQREEDGIAAFERLLRDDPLFQPDEAALSPRVRHIFHETRARVLPSVAQARYLDARAAWEREDYRAALPLFELVERIIERAGPRDGGGALSELRVLARGFADLARDRERAARASEAATPASSLPAPATRAPARSAPEILPPVTIAQRLPSWPSRLSKPPSTVGLLEVLIDEGGLVVQARMQQPLHPVYDQILIASTRDWRYEPARKDGQPTPFTKIVRVQLQP